MTWSFVTASNATGGFDASYTPIMAAAVQEHDLVVMTATCAGGDGITEVALSMDAGWTLITGVPVTATDDAGLYVWYAVAGAGGALPDLTVTKSGATGGHYHRAYAYRSSSGIPEKSAHALAADLAAGGTATLSDGVFSTTAGALIFTYATAGGATTYNSVTATDPSALSASNGTTHHSSDPEVDSWRQRGSLSASAGSGYAYSLADTVKTSVGPTGPIVWGKNSTTRKSSLMAVSFEATGVPPPTPPQGTTTITNIAPGVTSATVTYSYSAGDATGFEYRINGGTAASIGASPATISGLSASTSYSVEVRAINADGEGAWSAAYNFTTSATADTTAPTLTLPSATPTGTTTASGSVSTNEANGTLYYRALSTASPAPTTIKSGSSQAVTTVGPQNVTVSGLTGSTAYYLHFLHRDAAGNDSAVETSAQFTTAAPSSDTTPPALTGSVTFTSITQTGYIPNWSAGSDNVGVLGYEYQIGSTAGAWTDVGNNRSVAITGRTPGATETVYVRAYDAAGLRSTPAISGSVTLLTTAPKINVTEPLKNNTGTVLANLSGVRVAVLQADDLAGVYRTFGLTTNAAGILSTISGTGIVAGQQYRVVIKLADGSVGITGPISAS